MKRSYLFHSSKRAISLLIIMLILTLYSCSNFETKQPEILTFEQLQKMEYKTPYIIDLQKGKKHLIFYGSDHTNDPANPMFDDIEKRFLDMQPDIAFNEGGDPPSLDDRKIAMEKFGEAGLLKHLGKKHNVPVKNVEPTLQDQFDYFLKKYSRNDLLLMYFCRQILQIQRMSQTMDVDFNNYIYGFLKQLQKEGFPISDEEATLKYAITVYEDFFKEKFDWKTFDRKNISPMGNESVLNEISRESGQFRDKYIVNLISDALKKYDRVFVVMGSGHAVKQEPVLKSFFK
ncbi:hypothetical protein KAU32_09775 [bacterium]|nr:hypothetical protein [bacterium]